MTSHVSVFLGRRDERRASRGVDLEEVVVVVEVV